MARPHSIRANAARGRYWARPLVGRQDQRKRGPLPDLGRYLDTPAKQLGESARNVESEPGSSVPPGERRVELRERLEQPVEVAFGDADSRVAHGEADVAVAAGKGRAGPRFPRGVLPCS